MEISIIHGVQVYIGERIFLRELQHRDVTERYLSWFKDDIVTQFLEAKNLTYDDVVNYMDHGRETKTYFMYAICMRDDDLHIGNLKVGTINRKHMISDLVVMIGDRDYWGKGLATEAILLGNKLAFEIYDIRKLTGGMYSNNIASIKCYKKAGWVEEARLRGHYILNNKVVDRVCISCFNPRYFSVNVVDGETLNYSVGNSEDDNEV